MMDVALFLISSKGNSFLFLILGSSLVTGILATARCGFPQNPVTIPLMETIGIGFNILNYNGIDRAHPTSIIYYSTEDIAPFRLDRRTLVLNSPLDFETKTQYIIDSVGVRDRFTTEERGDLCQAVTIRVLPANEYSPVFNPPVQNVTILEGSPQDVIVADLNCTDMDKEEAGNPDGCSTVTIQSGDDALSKFTIVNNAIVTTSNVIDYDTGDVTYTLVITGEDYAVSDPRQTGTMTINVIIEPVNEFVPIIQGQPLEISIPEDTPLGFEILSLLAIDDDAGPHGEITFGFKDGDTKGTFLISETTGKIYLRSPLDFDSVDSSIYYLTVEVTDGHFSSTAVVNVTVTDVNDKIPVCTQEVFYLTIDEDLPIGNTIVSLECTDEDAGTDLSYQIISGDLGHFTITSAGDIFVTQELGYDNGIHSYKMEVEISDGLHKMYVWILIQLNPVNEFPPIVTNTTVKVSEKAPIGHVVTTYVADDDDAPPHDVTSYQIINVENGVLDTFYMDGKTGKISLTEKLNFEKIPQFLLIVWATDGGGITATGTVTVDVDNENDNVPTCKRSSGIISVSENAAVGEVVVADLECVDLDNNPLTYFLTLKPSDGTFEVDAVTNQLKVTGVLDFETTPFYHALITVSDGSLSTIVELALNIKNENEAPPVFLNQVIHCTVSEKDSIGKYVATVTASDEENRPPTYSFVGTYPIFLIDSSAGEIRIREQIDREKTPFFDILVKASDGEMTSTATVSVTVEDINEMPQFDNSTYEFFVEENKSIGDTVGTLSAIDPDVGLINGEIRYKIVSENDESFNIDALSGIITLVAPIDFEYQGTSLLEIEVSDLGTPALFSLCTVIIHIIDINDNPPAFLASDMRERVSEDVPVGHTLTQVYAFDKDSSLNHNNDVIYQSLSSVPFTVDPFSGFVKVSGNLDRERNPRYEMILTATDNGSPRLTGTLTLEIEIIDVNDNDPVITGQYIALVPENVPLNFVVFRINARDADGEIFGKLKYEIISSAMSSVFRLEENTGTLQIASMLDRESTDLYEVSIRVSDNGIPPRSTTMTATITVLDENDFAPTTSVNILDFKVLENASKFSTIGTVSVTDNDIGLNAQVTFSIVTYWKGSKTHFEINPMTGDIYTTETLDRELQVEYSFLLRLQDGGTPSLFSDVNVNIEIEDANDNPPVFRRLEYSTGIFENTTSGSKILTTGATDRDVKENAEIRYELDISTRIGLKANYYFGVHGETGDVFLIRKVDRETYDSFEFILTARDNGIPSLSSSVIVRIKIVDVNDNAPAFSPTFYNTEASNVNLCDAVLADVTATDADLGDNAVIYYQLSEEDASSPFSISKLGTVRSNSNLALSKYIIKIIARDNGNPVLTSQHPATIRIDTFDPESSVVKFFLNLTLLDYLNKEPRLVRHIGEILSEGFPLSYVRRWCVMEETPYVVLHAYAVKNDVTNDVNNLHRAKEFLTNGEVLDALQLDQKDKPMVDQNGNTWDEFRIEKVLPYGGKAVTPKPAVSQSSEKKSTDLAIPLGVPLSLLISLFVISTIIIYCAWRRKWCWMKRKNDHLNKPRVQIIEPFDRSNKSSDVLKEEQESDKKIQLPPEKNTIIDVKNSKNVSSAGYTTSAGKQSFLKVNARTKSVGVPPSRIEVTEQNLKEK